MTNIDKKKMAGYNKNKISVVDNLSTTEIDRPRMETWWNNKELNEVVTFCHGLKNMN